MAELFDNFWRITTKVDLIIKTSLTQEQTAGFKKAIQDFVQQVDQCSKNGTIEGSRSSELQKYFDESLVIIEYISKVDFGSGKLAQWCSVGFYRKDLLNSSIQILKTKQSI